MTDNKYILILFILFIFAIIIIPDISIASIPYNNYTYNFWEEAEPAPQAYIPEKVIKGQDFEELGSFNEPTDFYIHNDRIFLLDSGNNRIIVINDKWELENVISEFENQGNTDQFNNPQGIFVDDDLILVADTDNGRIIELTQDGEFIREIGRPIGEENLGSAIPDKYQPLKVARDSAGRTFVIVNRVFEGLVEIDNEGNFEGFIGAPEVSVSPWDYFWRLVATEEQSSRMSLILPTVFSNFDINIDGFIYTTISTAVGTDQYIRRLNPAGTDTLNRMGFVAPRGDVDYLFSSETHPEYVEEGSIKGSSRLVDVASSEYGMYSVLDQRRGRIFTYDNIGNMLYVFGGPGGNIKGTFDKPVALDTLGEKILVLDRNNRLTVFKPTEYAKAIHEAIIHYEEGYYDLSASKWRDVLDLNSNFSLAYKGIGRNNLRNKKYKSAMLNFRRGEDREGYSSAFFYYRKNKIEENFSIIISLLVFFIFLLYIIAKTKGKLTKKFSTLNTYNSNDMQKKQSTKNSWLNFIKTNILLLFRNIKTGINVIFHPFNGFWQLKSESKGSFKFSFVILIIMAFTYIFMVQYTGFIFNPRRASDINFFVEILSVIIPISLWTIVNWGASIFFDGTGKMKDIFMSASYSLIPVIIIFIPMTVISNYLLLEEGPFYYFLLSIGVLWTFLLLFTSTIVIHEFSLIKNIVFIISIIVGIGIVIFMIVLLFSVINTFWAFVSGLITEIQFRL